MNPYIPSCIALLLLVSACGERAVLPAKVFERRALKGSRLFISYRYVYKDRIYTDSATVANVVFNTDSIPVIIDTENPGRSLPDLKK
jgi:hypothetical protein